MRQFYIGVGQTRGLCGEQHVFVSTYLADSEDEAVGMHIKWMREQPSGDLPIGRVQASAMSTELIRQALATLDADAR